MKELFDETGRKFFLTVVLLIIFTAFVVIGKMDVDQFITAVLVNLGIFSGANVIQKFSK